MVHSRLGVKAFGKKTRIKIKKAKATLTGRKLSKIGRKMYLNSSQSVYRGLVNILMMTRK
jgi:hypothetical protein